MVQVAEETDTGQVITDSSRGSPPRVARLPYSPYRRTLEPLLLPEGALDALTPVRFTVMLQLRLLITRRFSNRQLTQGDSDLIGQFRCSTQGFHWEAEVKRHVQSSLVDWQPPLSPLPMTPRALLLLDDVGAVTRVVAHEISSTRLGVRPKPRRTDISIWSRSHSLERGKQAIRPAALERCWSHLHCSTCGRDYPSAHL